jgi:uncharacterized membrane protein YfcA
LDLTPFLTFEFSMAALAAFAGAYIRGFTGFGANLIWAPVLVSVMDPVQAVAIMGLVGMVGTVQIAIPAAKDANWKEILPIVLASWITVPFGIWALYFMEAENVRRVIGIFILLIAFILMTGWRYHGDRTGIKGRLAQATTRWDWRLARWLWWYWGAYLGALFYG